MLKISYYKIFFVVAVPHLKLPSTIKKCLGTYKMIAFFVFVRI